MRVWFNRHFACVARVIQELRNTTPPLPIEPLVSHRHEHFAGYAVAAEAFLEPAGLEADNYLKWVLETVRDRRIECLVPGHEQSFLTSHTAALERDGCRVFAAGPAEVLARIHRKDLVYEDVASLVDLPLYAVCNSPVEARRLVEQIEDGGRRKVCLKPCVSVYGKGFTRITALPDLCRSWQPDVDQWARQQATTVFRPHIVMEFLPGYEYSVDIAARRGVILACVVRRKPMVSGGQLLVDMPELTEGVARLVKRYRLNGLLNVQFREDESGKPRLLEINPRASGGIGMSCLAGINLPAVAFRGFLEPSWQPPIQNPSVGRHVLEIPRAVICPDVDPVSPAWAADALQSNASLPDEQHVDLPTGRLLLTINPTAEAALGELLGFGARRNPRRGFLLVSKVLGKHWPASPSAMARVQRRLAERIVDTGLHSDGFLVVGMAETATGLGHGVYESLLDVLGPNARGVVTQSTRYLQAGSDAERVDFEEVHSHGSRIVLPLPKTGPEHELVKHARTLILCDDEVSTGSTFANLVTAIRSVVPSIRDVIVATLVDMSGGGCRERLAGIGGVEGAEVVSLLSGAMEFNWNPAYDAGPPPPRTPIGRLTAWSPFSARGGCRGRMQLPPNLVDRVLQHVPPGNLPLLFVGTGEFLHPAFRLASAIEARGLECRVQSTTRSPLLIAGDIRSWIAVPDVTGNHVPHFLYNFAHTDYRVVVVVHESPEVEEVERLCGLLAGGGRCLEVNILRDSVRVHAATATAGTTGSPWPILVAEGV